MTGICNTNLAAEFHALSMLYRLSIDASLTLGNKKAVDIIVTNEDMTSSTIDVKGIAKRYDWPADNIRDLENPRHFYALVSFEGKIDDPLKVPSVWIIPANQLNQFIRRYKTRTVVSRADIGLKGQKYLHAWSLIAKSSSPESNVRVQPLV